MALACLVCHVEDSPSRSLSSNETRCPRAINCLNRRKMAPPSSKVAPLSLEPGRHQGPAGGPRLVRSLAVSRDLVRDWKFDENPPAQGWELIWRAIPPLPAAFYSRCRVFTALSFRLGFTDGKLVRAVFFFYRVFRQLWGNLTLKGKFTYSHFRMIWPIAGRAMSTYRS